jgi:CBS-domain-containing membrane protein
VESGSHGNVLRVSATAVGSQTLQEETVKASDVMRPAAVLHPDDPAEDLVRAFARPSLRAVAIVSPEGELIGLVTDEDLLYALLPPYVLDDHVLARVLERDVASELRRRLEGKRVKNVINIRRRQQLPVGPNDTLVEVTTAMVRAADPAVLVVEDDVLAGVITVDDLLQALLGGRLS